MPTECAILHWVWLYYIANVNHTQIEIFCSCTIFVFFFLYSSFFFLGTCGVLVATFLYGVPERSQAAEVKPV